VDGLSDDRLPWLPYLVTWFLDGYLTPYMSVFEWGAGGSSFYCAERAGSVVSIEHDPDWSGRLVALPCVVTGVARQISRRDSSEWGKITVEDFHGTATVLAFGDVWQKHKDVLRQDSVVEVTGRVSGRERDEEDPPIFLDTARPLEDVTPELAVQIELELGSDLSEGAFAAARELLATHPGASPVWIQVGPDNGERAPRLRSRSLRVAPDAETLRALQKLFGRGNVRLVRIAVPEQPAAHR